MNNHLTRLQCRPTAVLAISSALQQRIFTPAARERLASLVHVVGPTVDDPSSEAMVTLLEDAEICITGWGTPQLSEALLDRCPSLRFIAHTAGSVRNLLPPSTLQRGIVVTHAAGALAEGVAEFTVLQVLLCLTRLHLFDRQLKQGQSWEDVLAEPPGHLLRAQTVGIVGAGRIGREVIMRLRPFHCQMQVYDPYLSVEEALAWGVSLIDLDTLFATSDVVGVHAPLLPETQGMIGAAQLARLRDGAVLLNTARAGLFDEVALVRELKTGRFMAALDVFHDEPLPVDSPLRALPNVVLSPHIAALTVETLYTQGQMMVDEIERFLRGEPLQHAISEDRLPIIA